MKKVVSVFVFILCLYFVPNVSYASSSNVSNDHSSYIENASEKGVRGVFENAQNLYYGLNNTIKDVKEAYYWFSVCQYETSWVEKGPYDKHIYLAFRALNSENIHGEESLLVYFLGIPRFKEFCDIYVEAVEDELTDKEVSEVKARLRDWKSKHPLPEVRGRTEEEEYQLLLLDRLQAEIWHQFYQSDMHGIKRILESMKHPIKLNEFIAETIYFAPHDVFNVLSEYIQITSETPVYGIVQKAMRKDRMYAAEVFLDRGFDGSPPDENGRNLIYDAVEDGDLYLVNRFIQNGANLKKVEEETGFGFLENLSREHQMSEDMFAFILARGVSVPGADSSTFFKISERLKIKGATVARNLFLASDPQRAAKEYVATLDIVKGDSYKAKPKKQKKEYDPADIKSVFYHGSMQEKEDAFKKVMSDPGNYAPPVLYAMSEALFRQFRDDEGLFWQHAALLREHVDLVNCAPKGKIKVFNKQRGERSVNHYYMLMYPEKIKGVIQRAVKWDMTVPRDYYKEYESKGIYCFEGVDVFNTGVNNYLYSLERISPNLRDKKKAGFSDISMEDLLQKARAGDKEAQYNLAQCYLSDARYFCNKSAKGEKKLLDMKAQWETLKSQYPQYNSPHALLDAEYKLKAFYWFDKSVDYWLKDRSSAHILNLMAQGYAGIPPFSDIYKDNKKACVYALMLQKQGDSTLYRNIMPKAPWNPKAGEKAEDYAWEAVSSYMRNKDQKKSGFSVSRKTKRGMTDAEIAEGEKRANLYIEKYINNKKPVCDFNSY